MKYIVLLETRCESSRTIGKLISYDVRLLCMNIIPYSLNFQGLKFSRNHEFSSFVDKIFVDCRSTVLRIVV